MPVPAGWPADVSDGDYITAAHINAVKASAYEWPGVVNAQGFRLSSVSNATPGTDFSFAGLELRENQLSGGTHSGNLAYAPRIAFHWSTIAAAQIAVNSAGALLALDNPGTGPAIIGAAAFVVYGAGLSQYYSLYRDGATGFLVASGLQTTFSGFFWATAPAGEVMRLDNAGALTLPFLPSSNPGAGTKKLWYDPSDGNAVKFAA